MAGICGGGDQDSTMYSDRQPWYLVRFLATVWKTCYGTCVNLAVEPAYIKMFRLNGIMNGHDKVPSKILWRYLIWPKKDRKLNVDHITITKAPQPARTVSEVSGGKCSLLR